MKRSFITWRLSFGSLPTKEELDKVAELVGGIERTEKPADYGFIFREFGQSDHLLIEAEAELSPGEIALQCLQKAHRLGRGWAIIWPRAAAGPEPSAAEWRLAALPESLAGLTGILNPDQALAELLVPKLCSAAFNLTISDEAIKAAPEPPPPPIPYRQPSIESLEFNVYIRPALDKLLAQPMLDPWSWEPARARQQLERMGFTLSDDLGDELIFKRQDKISARLRLEAGAVRAFEFIVSAFPDPHLLDETAFAAKQTEYENFFHNAANHVELFLGPPLFIGASGEPGFPPDLWADFAALWNSRGNRIFIAQKHDDKELPIELCLLFGPTK
jgi:hypothetical protein